MSFESERSAETFMQERHGALLLPQRGLRGSVEIGDAATVVDFNGGRIVSDEAITVGDAGINRGIEFDGALMRRIDSRSRPR